MANSLTTAELTSTLASEFRVIMLGGLAVISHGHSRTTYDAYAWLDPTLPLAPWCAAVSGLLRLHSRLSLQSIGEWQKIDAAELPEAVERAGVVRILGANQPLDIFRSPNELPVEEFDAVWERAEPLDDGTRLPDAVDLLMTKQSTGRDKDMMDILFLEAKAERHYLETLPGADPAIAAAMLERFLTPKVAEAALEHPAESVRGRATHYLKELADDGDPFALEILKKHS